MPAEYTVKWYEPTSEAKFEAITDHTGWQPIEVRGVTYLPECLQGTVDMEPGYIRAKTLFGDDPQTYGELSNIQTVPEPPVQLTLCAALTVAVLLAKWRNRVAR